MSIEPNSKGVPTCATIETWWQGMTKPSRKKVEAAMREDGYDISASTIGRAIKSGFKPKERSTKPTRVNREANAINRVKAVAGKEAPTEAVAEAIVEAIRNLPAGEQDRLAKLIAMPDDQLRDGIRKLHLAAGYLLAEDLAKHTSMMMLVPDKAARLYEALGSTVAPGAGMPPLSMPPPETVRDGSDARVIQGREVPRLLSPTAEAINDFLAKEGMAA